MVILSLMILIIAIALTSDVTNLSSNLSSVQNNDNNKSVKDTEINNYKNGNIQNEINSLSSEIDSLNGGISAILIARLTSIVFLFSGALAYNALYIQEIGSGFSIYSGLFHINVLSQSFDVILFVLGSLILIPWSNNYWSKNNINIPYLTGPIVKEYSLIVLFSTLGSSLLISSGNLISMYLAIELQSFGVYILATIYRNSESATNAGLKYFLLGGLSSCLILLGCVLIYSYTGLINFEDIYSLVSSSSSIIMPQGTDIITIVILGIVLIFIGLLFKIASAPFHNWAPDVYNDVPTIVTTWLTIMPKIAIIILSFEIISTINLDNILLTTKLLNDNSLGKEIVSSWSLVKNLLLIGSFLSLIIGTVVGLAQVKIKRLLAYSTISHVGFLLLALSINTEDSLESLLFYLIQYSFTNLNTFFILLSFGYLIKKSLIAENKNVNVYDSQPSINDINFISELKGQFISNPLLSLSLALCLFSMAGIPPLMGFFAKAQVLYSATQNSYYFISIVAILVSVISAYYYLQIIRVLHFDGPMSTEIPADPLCASAGFVEQKSRGSISFISNEYLNLESSSMDSIESDIKTPNLFINNTHSYIISTLTLSLLLFMLKPSILLNSIHLMALNVFYT